MTHEESQGLAALDAVGAASDAERAALRAHLAECAECRSEHRGYEDIASVIGYSLDPVAPPPEVRGEVLRSARRTATTSVYRLIPAWTPTWWLAAAAAFFLALFGWSELRLRAARETVAELQAHQHALEEENRRLADVQRRIAAQAESLASPSTRMLALAGQEAAPSAAARVFLDESRRRAIVFFRALPLNGSDQSYQLWIIRADRPEPQSAGVFDVDANGNAQMTVENLPIETEIKAFAVTLEPRGGVSSPTGAQYLIGGV